MNTWCNRFRRRGDPAEPWPCGRARYDRPPMRTQLSPEEQEAARLIEEQDRLRFSKEGHKKGRWDEAHFGVRAAAPKKPEPKASPVGAIAKLTVVIAVLACAGLAAHRWLLPAPEQEQQAQALVEQESPYEALPEAPTLAEAPAEPEQEPTPRPEAKPVLVNSAAMPAAPSAAELAARQRGIDHLTKQRAVAESEVAAFLAAIKRAGERGRDGLTYEERLLRDRKAAHAVGRITSEQTRLELAWDQYVARKDENAKRLAHAREVLASLDKRINALRNSP